MMYTILVFLSIISYMINGYAGIAVTLALIAYIFYNSGKSNMCEKSMKVMISVLPLSYIGILGMDSYQMLSWYNLFLIVFLVSFILLLHRKIKMMPFTLTCVSICYAVMIFNCLSTDNIVDELKEIAQLSIMLVPLVLVHYNRTNKVFDMKSVNKLQRMFVSACVAAAAAEIIQLVLYRYRGIQIGFLDFQGNNRVQFQCLFKGRSILPVYFGVGLLYLAVDLLYHRFRISSLLKSALVFAAMTANSSRTGIAFALLVIALIIVRKMWTAHNLKMLIASAVLIVAAMVAMNYIMSLRTRLSGFWDSNGRESTLQDSLRIWQTNTRTLLFGAGFSGEEWVGVVKAHNIFIQSLAQCGLVFTAIIAIMQLAYLFDARKSHLIYIPIYLLLTGMVVTDFYANPFTTVSMMLVDLSIGSLKYHRKVGRFQQV